MSELKSVLKKSDEKGFLQLIQKPIHWTQWLPIWLVFPCRIGPGEAFYIPIGHQNKSDPLIKKQLKLKDVLNVIKPYSRGSNS